MVSKSRSLSATITVILLVLVAFGFQNYAKAQVGTNNLFCPGQKFKTGWLDTLIAPDGKNPAPDVSIALLGQLESVNGHVLAGMDWQHVDDTSYWQPNPTNEDGSQVATWWSEANGRNTSVQLTNDTDSGPVSVHVQIFGEDCLELTDFCDDLTPNDTHVYDLGDLIGDDGTPQNSDILQGHEGFMTITAVNDCQGANQAIQWNHLVSTVQVSQTLLGGANYDNYGFNAYHRTGVCKEGQIVVNRINNGSFQDGYGSIYDGAFPELQFFPGRIGGWRVIRGCADVISRDGISEAIDPPACPVDNPPNPDCMIPTADTYQAYAVDGNACPDSDIFTVADKSDTAAQDLLAIYSLEGFRGTVLQSNRFTPQEKPDDPGLKSGVLYDIRKLANNECSNITAVCVAEVDNHDHDLAKPQNIHCNCYVDQEGAPLPKAAPFCDDTIPVAANGQQYALGPLSEFLIPDGASTVIHDSVDNLDPGDTYRVMVIANQTEECRLADESGALVDNFRFIGIDTFDCTGILTGASNAFLNDFTPSQFMGQFNLFGTDGGSDAILINYADDYSGYSVVPTTVNVTSRIWDDAEHRPSCGSTNACFLRLGIDDPIVDSDDFVPSSPTATAPTLTPVTPTPIPTETPTTSPTTTPTRKPGGGGGCAITGAPVHLGTAFANLLIPLVPVAFAFGVKAVRRRKKAVSKKK